MAGSSRDSVRAVGLPAGVGPGPNSITPKSWRLAGVLLVFLLLPACSSPLLRTLTIRETAAGWPDGQEATVAAVAAPFGDEIVLATGTVDAKGTFAVSVQTPDSALLLPATQVYLEVPECDTNLSDPAASLLFLTGLFLQDEAAADLGALVADQELPGGRVRSLGYVYSDVPLLVSQLCRFEEGTFDTRLELPGGWAPLLLEAPTAPGDTLFRIRSGPPAAAMIWRYRAPEDPVLRRGSLPAALAWLQPFLAAEVRESVSGSSTGGGDLREGVSP